MFIVESNYLKYVSNVLVLYELSDTDVTSFGTCIGQMNGNLLTSVVLK